MFDKVKEVIAFIFKVIKEGITYAGYAQIVLGVASAFFSGLKERLEKLVDQEDEIINSLPSLDEQALEIRKALAFKRVVDTTHANFAGAVPKGIIKSVAEVVIYKKHHPEDSRNQAALSEGYIKVYESEDPNGLKKAVEEGLNQGWGHGR